MRILLDYRPALRDRTGVGEYVHELTRALARLQTDDLSIFTTSWKDRPVADLQQQLGHVRIVDRRVPVRALAWAWNRVEWPPVEWFAGAVDVVHSQSPLLIPATHAAQVVTIHDLDFLHHPQRFTAEMRRDYPSLVSDHARRADHVIVSSHYAAREVVNHLEISPDRIGVCSPGAPDWAEQIARDRDDAGVLATPHGPEGSMLFVGTVEPRKNLSTLLDACEILYGRHEHAPPLVIAGHVRPASRQEVDRASAPPLQGRVSFLGYVSEERRRTLYREARVLVLPSLEEGFGLPVLEAMACGVPVVISDRGSLPEVAGDAARPVEATDARALAAEIEHVLRPEIAHAAAARGRAQAARFSWDACAAAARVAYRAAVAQRERRRQ